MSGMKLLAIDAGNSRIKWGLADVQGVQGWVRRGVVDTSAASTLAQALGDLPPLTRVVASNVAGTAVRKVIDGVAPHCTWVSGRVTQCGVRNGYADPTQLGADRWAALIGAWKIAGVGTRGVVVVNAGTTMTVDALSHEGVFLGGMIVPGMDLMRASLDRGTAQLHLQAGGFHYFPDNTADAIMSGAVNALTGAIDRMRGYLAETMAETALTAPLTAPLTLISGGAAPVLLPCLRESATLGRIESVDNLVLEGLLEIARDSG